MRTVCLAGALCLAGLAGCNAIFGVEEGNLGGVAATTGTTTSATTSGAGGAGGTGGASTATTTTASTTTGGGGGAGGEAPCPKYKGDGMVTATDTGGSNFPTLSFSVAESISGLHDPIADESILSMGGYEPSTNCGIGVRVVLSGLPVAAHDYAIVDDLGYASSSFHDNDYAYVTLLHDLPPCGNQAPEMTWTSVPSGTQQDVVTVDSVEGRVVTITLKQVDLSPQPGTQAQGTMRVEGTVHADCFELL